MQITSYNRSLYLNCRTMQVISYLSSINAPIELLFYNAMESSDKIFDQIITQRKSRYQYKTNLLIPEDLELIGVRENFITVNNLSEIESVLVNLIAKEKVVFIWLDQFYFSHRAFYLTKHNFHSFIINSLEISENDRYYHFIDLDPDINGKFKDEILIKSLEHSDFPINIDYYDFDQSILHVNRIQRKYEEWIRSYSDSYHFYDWLSSILGENINNHILNRVDHALAIIIGSRYLFSKYLEYINPNDIIVLKMKEIYQIAEIIKNILLKYSITGLINEDNIKNLVKKLKKCEINMMIVLKASI
ncbi:hypothetical protein MNQ98_12005 [Paenibacillus sp. N3/727]|uniref:hypothetical protein n=1 Tax=Paenibacillus sp. N3/727 TaxID=2925845 RepID=UPI001F5389F1|nr:hypothetical protein [Paenibacillus sp. N3/727]UNK20684.1 hypothetical protein MNQ98_12005 [Paenibacillus sp. N3/727]